MESDSAEQVVRGQEPTEAERERYNKLKEVFGPEKLKELFSPEKGMKRVEEYAKWLFASTTVISALGAGLSNAAFARLEGPGKVVFAIALLLLGLSLALAALTLAPVWPRVSFHAPDSMEKAIRMQFTKRRPKLQWAASLFAASLILAALSPLAPEVSKWFAPKVDKKLLTTYTLKNDGDFEAKLSAVGLKPYAAIELNLQQKSEPTILLAQSRGVVSDSGKGELKLTATKLNEVGGILVLITRYEEPTSGALNEDKTFEFVLPAREPQSKPRNGKARRNQESKTLCFSLIPLVRFRTKGHFTVILGASICESGDHRFSRERAGHPTFRRALLRRNFLRPRKDDPGALRKA